MSDDDKIRPLFDPDSRMGGLPDEPLFIRHRYQFFERNWGMIAYIAGALAALLIFGRENTIVAYRVMVLTIGISYLVLIAAVWLGWRSARDRDAMESLKHAGF